VARAIVFLSDFGLQDEFVGTCHAVVARLAPAARVIDLSHGVPPGDVLRGALLLRGCLPFVPDDAVLLGVVDPGVGGSRTPLAVRTPAGILLVGPDNGLLSLAWEALGGVAEAVRIDAPDVVFQPTSRTFHGRDVFAPAAARLAEGGAPASLGTPVPPASLVTLEAPTAEVDEGAVAATVLSVDRFGNVSLAATAGDLRAAGLDRARALEVRTRERVARATPGSTFGDVEPGMLVVLVDSAGWAAIGRNGGSAADLLAASPGSVVRLRAVTNPAGQASPPSAGS